VNTIDIERADMFSTKERDIPSIYIVEKYYNSMYLPILAKLKDLDAINIVRKTAKEQCLDFVKFYNSKIGTGQDDGQFHRDVTAYYSIGRSYELAAGWADGSEKKLLRRKAEESYAKAFELAEDKLNQTDSWYKEKMASTRDYVANLGQGLIVESVNMHAAYQLGAIFMHTELGLKRAAEITQDPAKRRQYLEKLLDFAKTQYEKRDFSAFGQYVGADVVQNPKGHEYWGEQQNKDMIKWATQELAKLPQQTAKKMKQ